MHKIVAIEKKTDKFEQYSRILYGNDYVLVNREQISSSYLTTKTRVFYVSKKPFSVVVDIMPTAFDAKGIISSVEIESVETQGTVK